MTTELLDKLMSRVDRTGECWLWTGAINRDGYGNLRQGSRFHRVHRLAYELLVGPITEGLVLDHLCRVRRCINPAHLEPVTRAENTRRGVTRNSTKTHCLAGHPYDEVNTYVTPTGHRDCRTCRRAAGRRAEAKRSRTRKAVAA